PQCGPPRFLSQNSPPSSVCSAVSQPLRIPAPEKTCRPSDETNSLPSFPLASFSGSVLLPGFHVDRSRLKLRRASRLPFPARPALSQRSAALGFLVSQSKVHNMPLLLKRSFLPSGVNANGTRA